ncbi:F-box/LRR-repeat protein 12-like isoform X2 [Gigantopelta aegis]|nr:F-box/LRR-repeat protein 12-like isoform X2 [Gigantopelta aegis]XP_041358087.1 F-box/LRR-repeat protein 12-like isoform X2 [Gigantopelta aegis]XP_041358088.1 F-box/LRR-repeat protein 12-like isoform X2 [Gigantopelta aegis]
MWKVLRAHFSECLLTFRLRGFLDPSGTKWKKHSLSDAMLGELRDRCPRIKSLHLEQCNTDNLTSDKLPSSLTQLTLRNCSWQPRWLKPSDQILSNLKHLDLSQTTRVDNFDAEDISTFSSLEELKLNSCYRVGETGLEKLTKLSRLRELEISGTGCTDMALHHICRHLGDLRRLNISKCTKFTGSSIQNIGLSLKCLEYLNVSECTQLNLAWLQCLSGCSKLREIDVSGVNLTDEDEKALGKFIACVTMVKKKFDVQSKHKDS